jgi:hypothetical protein
VRLLQAYEKLNDWSIRDLKNRALSERIALLKELKAVGDLGMTEQQIKDLIRAIRDIRARQEQKAALVERNAHVASTRAVNRSLQSLDRVHSPPWPTSWPLQGGTIFFEHALFLWASGGGALPSVSLE